MMNLFKCLFVIVPIYFLPGCTDPPTPPETTPVLGETIEPPAEPAAIQQEPGPERIVFSSLRPSNWDIFYFVGPGAEPRRLTDNPGLDYDAEFSPDGRWIVFTSERLGNPDLYAIDLQNEGAKPQLLIDSVAMEDQGHGARPIPTTGKTPSPLRHTVSY